MASHKYAAALAASVALLQEVAEALKVGHISDLHLLLNYDPLWGPYTDHEGDCVVDSGIPTDVKAPMGRYGCDSPSELIETMLDEFIISHGKQDVIVLTGDFSGHNVAMDYPYDQTSTETFSLLMATHAGLT